MRSPGRAALTIVVSLAATATGCGTPQPIDGLPGSGLACTTCHGGAVDQTGAPPLDTHGHVESSWPGVGAHARHVRDRGYGCTQCHPDPRQGSTTHDDGKVDVVFGGLATDGARLASRYDPSGGCSDVYCHGAFPGGNSANTPRWTRVDGTQAACGTCHGDPTQSVPALPGLLHAPLADGSTNATCHVCHPDAVDAAGEPTSLHVDGVVETDPAAQHPPGWLQLTSPDFHGRAAALDPHACDRCHAAEAPARVTLLTCATCHDVLAGGSWTTTCNTCHGSATNSAPPRDTTGNTLSTAMGVGAHQSHVTAPSGISPPFDCSFCHVKPSNVYDVGHLDGAVRVTGYTGTDAAWQIAGLDPAFDPSTGTCAAYCHGAAMQGGAVARPIWNRVDGTQAACGSCHGRPPASPPSSGHPRYVLDAPCAGCHPTTAALDPSRADVILSGGTHLNASVEFSFVGHPAGWVEPGDAVCGGIHGCLPDVNGYKHFSYFGPCTTCHGDGSDFTLQGGSSTVSCAACHRNAFDSTTCASLGTSFPCSCDLCHASPVVVIPTSR